MSDHKGRGPVATEDMKNRLLAGWSLDQLWERNSKAVRGEGFSYDFAESLMSAGVEDFVDIVI